MSFLSRTFDWLSGKLMFIGGLLLLAMVALTCIDVFGRLLGYPVFGAYELMSFMAALAAAAALPDTHANRRHIGVELVTAKLRAKTQHFIESITDIVALAIFFIVTWRMFMLAKTVRESGELSMNLNAPEYLIIAMVGIGFFLFTCAIIKTFCQSFKKLRES